MSIVDLCKKNYGRTWTIEMIAALVSKGKITSAQYFEITGKQYIP